MKHLYHPLLTTAALLLFLAGVPNVFAQPTPGNCEFGTATGTLDVNDVSASVPTTGTFFFGPTVEGASYYVPKEDSVSAIFTSALWVAGRVDQELRVAGTLYASQGGSDTYEFWPGPLNEGGTLPNPDDCSEWDRIWDVSGEDIEDYEETGIPTDDLAEWPYDLGAPVIDGDGDPDNYNLDAGDRPELIGDQALWWIMNDVGNEHLSTESDPIGIEVRAQAFSFVADDALDRATFYKLTLAYRGEVTLDSTYVTLWVDPDLGSGFDDLIGSDTVRSMGYVYNGAEEDSQYGIPPALGYDLLQGSLVPAPGETWEDPDGPLYEDTTRLLMTSLHYDTDDSGLPRTAQEFWNRMRGYWNDGSPIVACEGGWGCEGPITKFVFPGDPVIGDGWNEPISQASDKNMFVSTGPFPMQPGDEQEIIVAIVFGWGADRLDSITELRAASDLAQAFYEEGFPIADERGPEGTERLALSSRPNPADESMRLTFSLETPSEVVLEVYDALGRRITAVEGRQVAAGPAEIVLSTERWPAGTYIARLRAGDRVDRHRFVVVH